MELTQKQEAFSRNLFSGMSQYDAYGEAGYAVVKQTRATINANASRLANNVNILARLEGLNKGADSDSIATVKKRKEVLTKIVNEKHNDPVKARERIQAIAELNKMEKIYTDNVVNVDNRTLNIIVNSDKARELTEKLIEGERTE